MEPKRYEAMRHNLSNVPVAAAGTPEKVSQEHTLLMRAGRPNRTGSSPEHQRQSMARLFDLLPTIQQASQVKHKLVWADLHAQIAIRPPVSEAGRLFPSLW
jgi:hypothetical protein